METINKYSQMYLYAKGWFDTQVAQYGKQNIEMFIVSNYSGIYPEDASEQNFFSILQDAVYDYLKNQTDGVHILMNTISNTVTSYNIIQDMPNNDGKLPNDPIMAHVAIMKQTYINILHNSAHDTIDGILDEPMNMNSMYAEMIIRI
jgi:hypothetical protein